ncbi:hypothetical protein SAMN05421640_0219 [Ekhidna lutea]|uniref:Uncharacterized protein n=1 Tax=Ekhidna lutea TaxID=447679 RepID=A0A239ENT7_EKHLU|nr:hypothetical protein [Ekhidna lutea]SNS45534.1 hypothetical protein SAMN05421640_0219 [Ekhidna lutea]
MINKLFTTFLLCFAVASAASAQRIVVDTASTNKYLISPVNEDAQNQEVAEPTFGDRAISIGKGILNRLKARLNLEEAAESIKDKKDKILGKPEGDQDSG